MKSFLLLCIVALGMFSLVPLSVLGATGKWRATWQATRMYARCLFIVVGAPAMIGVLIALVMASAGIDLG